MRAPSRPCSPGGDTLDKWDGVEEVLEQLTDEQKQEALDALFVD